MHYQKKLGANLKKIKKYGGRSGMHDCYDTVCRECADLRGGNAGFARFYRSPEFPRLYNKLAKITTDGIFPDEKTLIQQFDGFLSVKENEQLRNTVRFFLATLVADSMEQGDMKTADHAIRSFFAIKDIDFAAISAALCKTDLIFAAEKAGIYPDMTEETKAKYLRLADQQAKKKKISTESYAESLVREADIQGVHVGFLLPTVQTKKTEGRVLLAAVGVLTLFSSIAVGILTENAAAGVLVFLPLYEIFFHLMRATAALRRNPVQIYRIKPKIALQQAQTVIVVSSVLPQAQELQKTEQHLQSLYLANRNAACNVCLLADLAPGKTKTIPSDKTNADAAKNMIDRLNARFGEKFTLALRERSFSKTEGAYIGAERKRGAVLALAKYIVEEQSDFKILHGAKDSLRQCDYMMLLDADTEIPFESLQKAVCAAVHPLNRPVIDPQSRTVARGYGILAPNAAPSVKSFSAGRFSRDMCKSGGTSAYDRAANDFYGDFFASGIFCGKGLAHIKTFYQTLNDRFPSERMLSHDVAEGIILRVLPLTDITLTDDFPRTENAYFKRENRWIRGDVQNLPLLGRKITAFGKRTASPFRFEDRYKLLDNLRRAVTPIAALVGILAAAVLPAAPAIVVILFAMLSRCAGDLLHGFTALFRGGLRALAGLYKEDALPEAVSAFLRALLMLAQTGIAGCNAADAVLRSLWRMTVSGKFLLSWTTAAAADRKSAFAAVLAPRIPAIAAAVLLCISARPLCIFMGLLFVFDVFYAYISQQKLHVRTVALSEKNREYIFSNCAEMWQYFADNFRAEYHYLPPDNVSISPLPDTAKRTSPTNIGLALCAFLAARDFGFIDSATLYHMLNKTLASVEKLEKWQGNLLNWYDIQTAQPLSPRSVSFVDSGNFICCITALKEGLYSYIHEDARLMQIAARLSAVIAACDLSAFYNPTRKLFAISYDLDAGAFSDSYYDLLMSEARMASYVAVASGQVPATHWSAPARTTAKCGRFSGALSWSGTMFEYFMPYIFLPSDKNTLADESLWFCVKSQMRYARKNKIPWGISESCFCAFNKDLSYSYKANGVPDAALKRFYEKDLIVSPYSSFLTLPFIPTESLDNLKRLEKYPSKGNFGFFEALDFTPGRGTREEPAPVRCFMVHHLGMSLLSCENALNGHIWQKRLMQNPQMAAAAGLLEEQIPSSDAYYKNPKKEPAAPGKEKRNESKRTALPAALYVGSGISAALHENGCISLFQGKNALLRKSANIVGDPQGVFAAIKTADGVIPFTAAPLMRAENDCRCSFGKNGAVYTRRAENLKLTQTMSVDRKLSCLQIEYKIKNLSAHPLRGVLAIYFEPSLSPDAAENAHRTYSKLFIKSYRSEKNGCVIFDRSTESQNSALAAGFADADFSFTTDKDDVLPIDGAVRALFTRNCEPNGRAGSTDSCFYAQTAFCAGARKELTFRFFLTAAESDAEAQMLFGTMKNGGFTPKAQSLQFYNDPQRQALAASLLSDLVFPSNKYEVRRAYASKNSGGVEQLWAVGVSGDRPLILFDADEGDRIAVRNFAAVCAQLHTAGIHNDLILLHKSNAGYEDSRHTEILCEVNAVHGEVCTTVFNRNVLPAGTENLFNTLAAAIYPRQATKELPLAELSAASPRNPDGISAGATANGYFIPVHPPVPWSRTLCNRSFGCLVTDRSLGFTWSLNAAENKLTPWTNDPHSDLCGELLTVQSGERHYDVIAGATACLGEFSATWQSHAAGCAFTATVCVPGAGMQKRLTVHVKNTARELFQGMLCYTVNPVMGRDLSYSKTILRKKIGNGVLLHNPYNRDFNGYLLLAARHAEVREGLRFRKNIALSEGVTLQIPLSLEPGEESTAVYTMSYGMSARAAVALQKLPLPRNKLPSPAIQSGDEKTDELVNLYLPHQTMYTRIFARCAFYQCGGAYGFRDQLQDCLNLVSLCPALLKQQLYRSAANQFPQGDVLHWWHVSLPDGRQQRRGVRTHCSDDLVWLAYATAEYVQRTNDTSVLYVQIPFSKGPLLKDGEKDLYFSPEFTEEKADLYTHCLRALDKAFTCGAHGLLRIGSGDWNDSFNAVGADGKGESVWLTMFYVLTLKKFLPLCRLYGDDENSGKFRRIIEELTENIETHAWDGDHYLRAFYDDGTPMGASTDDSCRIDLLPQSFAALAELPNKQRVHTALQTALEQLYDRKHGILRLFASPFTPQGKQTGYVNFYPPGVRENGGQYTHAAVWFLKALHREGFRAEAEELLHRLNPLNRIKENGLTGMYRNEPYAISADVYALKNYEGRGGWSLYTGAAGWLLSTATEMYPPSTDAIPLSPENNRSAEFRR